MLKALRITVSTATRNDRATKIRPNTVPSQRSRASFMRASLDAQRLADGLLPVGGARGIGLVADLGPGRHGDRRHRLAHGADVLGLDRDVDELELLARRARVLAGVAVQRILRQLLRVDPD